MKIFLSVAGATILTLVVGIVLFAHQVSRPVFNEVLDANELPVIAGRQSALTFARSGGRLCLVTDHHQDAVTAIDLSQIYGAEQTADLISFYNTQGYDVIGNTQAETVRLPLDRLGMPLEYHYPSVAVGANYAEHAQEVYLDDPPFLFPKLARPSNWNAPVDFVTRLDFEAELCMVPLSDITPESRETTFGLLICNDFTDRLTLVKQLNLWQPMGTTGFADGKGKDTFLPTGYLFVIPRDPDFYEQIVIELAVNGQLKQRFTAGEMILKIDQIIDQTFSLSTTLFHREDTSVPLITEEQITKGTLLMTGTAAGVFFKPANIWYQGYYLQLDDRVQTRGQYLGFLDNTIR
ncbi:hypothetical protein E3V39_03700 [Gammaproteobacteria bacterium LSUCC0112]|nr:hypothetical protein E3V39_03700 [Gammaproteobacteria bacterium LSUCC0112]